MTKQPTAAYTAQDYEDAKRGFDDIMFYAVTGGNPDPESFKRRTDNARRVISHALTLASKISSPDYKLVPVEPTREMLLAGTSHDDRCSYKTKITMGCVGEVYKAMLSAVQEG